MQTKQGTNYTVSFATIFHRILKIYTTSPLLSLIILWSSMLKETCEWNIGCVSES